MPRKCLLTWWKNDYFGNNLRRKIRITREMKTPVLRTSSKIGTQTIHGSGYAAAVLIPTMENSNTQSIKKAVMMQAAEESCHAMSVFLNMGFSSRCRDMAVNIA
jgi:hypothetical protein